MSAKATEWALEMPIKPSEKIVLVKLAKYANNDGECFPGLDRLQEDCQMSRPTLLSKLKKLVELGLISKQRRHNGSGHKLSNSYQLKLIKRPESLSKDSLPRSQENPLVKNSYVGIFNPNKEHSSSNIILPSNNIHDITNINKEKNTKKENSDILDSSANVSCSFYNQSNKEAESDQSPATFAAGHVNYPVDFTKKRYTSDNKNYPKSQKIQKVSSKNLPPIPVLPEIILQENWDAFLEHRRALKSPMSHIAQVRAIALLERLSKSGNDPNQVIEQSIINGWKGLFEIKKSYIHPFEAAKQRELQELAEKRKRADEQRRALEARKRAEEDEWQRSRQKNMQVGVQNIHTLREILSKAPQMPKRGVN